jgi:thioredoxin reductase (NADPH)
MTMITDITIVGGGPVGLFAAYCAGMRGLSVSLFETLPYVGGQLATLYPDKYIYDIAGIPKIKALDLIKQLQEQCSSFPINFYLNDQVLDLCNQTDHLQLKTTSGFYLTKALIIAAGCGAFKPKTLALEEAPAYEDKGLFYNVKNKNVLIAGGGDSALDWLLTLEPLAKTTTLIHRRDCFRAQAHLVNQAKATSANILTPYHITRLKGSPLNNVIIKNLKDEATMDLAVDKVLVNYGFKSLLGPLKNWSLELDGPRIKVNASFETNLPRVYAIGDVAVYPGKLRLITIGFGEAPIAIGNIAKRLGYKQTPLHSTALG